ncbi:MULTISPECIES: HDOD domain-containing protein [Methylocaldum]|jgi:HD-like signal output (HDOD) protein|uniref:HDOD domain-containing protein n=2 Tax=unclassified Methylocaldum TaxID=2622260 RepID=UPI00098A7E58|nr:MULTISPECIES: HDOD domain-containing protein [unclassified Methylocaldum]MVF20803.1 HDOD domain-containing protein [Methylocaldum sp. BRCS4]
MTLETADTLQNPLLQLCYQEMRAKKLVLPTLPDISLKIRKAINDDRANNSKIARVVQIDPAITARLIHIANSPLYHGRKKIESCPEALTRLGLKAAQHLITTFSLKAVFIAKSSQIRKRMHELWAHSSYVAAICAVLAHKTRGFDPDRAMLAALVHDIGTVPVLTFADRHPELIADPRHLDQAIQTLRAPVGAMILRKWNFPPDFEDVTVHAENWFRDHPGAPDYTDLVILSQLHSFVGTLQIHKYPRMDEIPAYRKLMEGQAATDLSKDVLGLAKEEILQIQQMLTR